MRPERLQPGREVAPEHHEVAALRLQRDHLRVGVVVREPRGREPDVRSGVDDQARRPRKLEAELLPDQDLLEDVRVGGGGSEPDRVGETRSRVPPARRAAAYSEKCMPTPQ
jgi:hypothetical protein